MFIIISSVDNLAVEWSLSPWVNQSIRFGFCFLKTEFVNSIKDTIKLRSRKCCNVAAFLWRCLWTCPMWLHKKICSVQVVMFWGITITWQYFRTLLPPSSKWSVWSKSRFYSRYNFRACQTVLASNPLWDWNIRVLHICRVWPLWLYSLQGALCDERTGLIVISQMSEFQSLYNWRSINQSFLT
jgi:hypothetical protein